MGSSSSPGTPSTPTAPVTPSPFRPASAISASGLPDGGRPAGQRRRPYPGSTFMHLGTGHLDGPPSHRRCAQRGVWAFRRCAGVFRMDAGRRPNRGGRGLSRAVSAGARRRWPARVGWPRCPSRHQRHTPVTESAYRTATRVRAVHTRRLAGRGGSGRRWRTLRPLTPALDGRRLRACAGRYTIATGAPPSWWPGCRPDCRAVLILAPDGTLRTVDKTTTITGLEPGHYRLVANNVVRQGITFRAPADTLEVDVVASLTAAPATITYVAQVGALALTVNGLPSSAEGAVTLSGNGSRARSPRRYGRFSAVGSYVTASAIVADGDRYAPRLHRRTSSSPPVRRGRPPSPTPSRRVHWLSHCAVCPRVWPVM